MGKPLSEVIADKEKELMGWTFIDGSDSPFIKWYSNSLREVAQITKESLEIGQSRNGDWNDANREMLTKWEEFNK